MIDLRSDTLTQPTSEMRRAMAEAIVGDDVYDEDPTVKELEKRVAEILGKEACIYMPSGTMSNQVAIRGHTEPGDEILIESEAHCYFYESGASAALAGVTCRLIPGRRGIFEPEDVRALLRPKNYHFPPTRLLCIENTHNRSGGSIWPLELIEQVAETAGQMEIALHLDGARLWNASVATGIAEREYAKFFDSVSVCFSKGLGAPVGSALAGTGAFINRARRFRKQFGGGMRQAGIIAAGALFAVDNHRPRLAEDHANAKKLALAITELPGIELNSEDVETNIVTFGITSMKADEFINKLYAQGVRVQPIDVHKVRAVTSLNITAKDMSQAIIAFEKVLTENKRS